MVATTQQKMVTGTINGQSVTVPAGTSILEASRSAGIDVPNLCFQPLMRAWGSCRICTVETLGRRGGLVESCAAQFTEGAEVLTHSEESLMARQYILQMYLIDHALDCPTCDKSGECYLQDNTYLHNINTNPYRRPKKATPYEHFSATIDYKWDRCIMCNRCTRVCDEIIGVTAIEAANRALEATIVTNFGEDMITEGSCVNCGMCIAVCPVGALTDRHFGHHPWELDTTETICGFCDVGCTINIESNKGIVRRSTNLWERGVNHGYVCEKGKWGHERVQSAERLTHPSSRDADGEVFHVSWDEALDLVADGLKPYRNGEFGVLANGEGTNEEAWVLQQFSRAVMQSNSVNRLLTPNQAAVERSTRKALGYDISSTNNMQELLSDAKNLLVVGPSIFEHAPVASYWINHSRIYRESRIVVVSTQRYLLADRAALWLQPNPDSTSLVLEGIAAEIERLGLAKQSGTGKPVDLDEIAQKSGVSAEKITEAAIIFVTSQHELPAEEPEGGYAPGAVFHTVAHDQENNRLYEINIKDRSYGDYEDAEAIAAACNNISIMSGNMGRAGGGVAALRGPANYQGVTDMGFVAGMLPGGASVSDEAARGQLEALWGASIPTEPGVEFDNLIEAIETGKIKAMWVEGGFGTRYNVADARLFEALQKLELLIVTDSYDSPLTAIAHIVLPMALNLEKDGTFTNFDRTVQRVRAAVPAMGEARDGIDIMSEVSRRMGYDLPAVHASRVMSDISKTVPGYAGITYARLERGGVVTPNESLTDSGTSILFTDSSRPPIVTA